MGNGDLQSMSLRLLVEKKTGRIIYGEAGKDFVDLILSFLVLPIGSVIKLLSTMKGPKTSVGSVTNLYESLDKLPSVLMRRDKSELLNPKVMSTYSLNTLGIDYGESVDIGDNFYVCGNNGNNFSFHSTGRIITTHSMSKRVGEMCVCGRAMKNMVQFRQNASEGVSQTNNQGATGSEGSGGYVKETVTFIITDELKVMPSSTIASITLLNRLNISDLSQLEERSADVGPNQVLALLFASLSSTTPLNDVFGVKLTTFAEEEQLRLRLRLNYLLLRRRSRRDPVPLELK